MLKRDISTLNILVASAGGMIGSGWLFSPFISAQMAGSNSLISWIIAAVFMLFIALPLCELGTMFPVSGGMSNYPTYTHGREVGFLFAWTSWLSYVVMTPIEIQAILQYSSHFFPILIDNHTASLTLSTYGYLAAIGIMFFVVILNSYGIKFLAECNKYASVIKFVLPSIAIISLLQQSPSLANININLSSKEHWVEIFTALSAGGVAFAFTGFQNGLILAGEVKNPQRNIPIAILGAVLVGFILYFMLQFSFIAAVPQKYLAQGWHALSYPGDEGPLVGLTLLLGLGIVATLLLFDAAFSPFGTTLVYTAATSRILYGMALNQHLPKFFLKVNRHNIPYVTLYANLLVGSFAFLPFPGWQKLVAFLSSASILSYGIGPICLLAMRKMHPNMDRPFKLANSVFLSHIAFYICNLMLYWCGFSIIWKLDAALLLGLGIYFFYHRNISLRNGSPLAWFIIYMGSFSIISYLGSFGGIGLLKFPFDLICFLPYSILMLYMSQTLVRSQHEDEMIGNVTELPV
ncbi:TPA: APC family permease [Legionella pneumophila]|uniref:APC family permease n=1 Tax=Legionella pneumophila TaxID=446 RepID=UPI0007877265|nr:APC family permease [Legionella pneumophila]MDW8880349.1 APC family permease [Legionella pneumophila subsp. fraseri]MDW8963257.1 APC family permease [Legionella pneumophila subsp. fraseri]MDW9036963.1 APC family permease [Legionella pneumophila subsp. fraseri]MDW9040104.1 APC family permease [Legionella pneumophila subsp. fraseri]MDW9043157.1 APC family permease [Legionella pneumophila subsp. fraseri]